MDVMNRKKSARSRRCWGVLGGLWLALAGCAPSTPVLIEPHLLEGSRVPVYSHGGTLYQLKNGLLLLALPDQRTNLVRIDVRYRYGAAMDPPGKTGLAHLVEHLTYDVRPAGERPTLIEEYLGRMTLDYNAYTAWDWTHYTAVALDDRLDDLLKLEFARMRTTCEQIDDALIERTREVVRNELRERRDMGLRATEQLYRDVYGSDHPYGRSGIGTDAEIAAIGRHDICEFLEQYYTPASAILVVSGHIDVPALTKRAGALFGSIDKTSEPRSPAVPAPVLQAGRTRHEWPVAEASAIIAFNAPRFTEPDAAYERLAIRLLRQRLLEIWKDTRYITRLEVGQRGGPQAPLTVISVSVDDPAKLDAAVNLVLDRGRSLTDRISPTALGRLLEEERLQVLRSVERFGDAALVFADYLQWADHRQFIVADMDTYQSMTVERVEDYANQRFHRRDSHIMSVYPTRSGQPPAEPRAAIEFSPQRADLPDWKMKVDESEATRSLTLPPLRDQLMAKRFRLKNGLSVVLAPTPGFPVVDIRLVLPAGSAHDPPDRPGLSGLAAYLTPMPEIAFGQHVDRTWAETVLHAFNLMSGVAQPRVGDTATTLHTAGLSTYADGVLWNLYWYVRTGGYTEENLRTVRDVLGRQQDDTDAGREERRLRELLFGANHPFTGALSMRGLLAHTSLDQLKGFKQRYYRASGATLIVTGEFPAEYMERQIRRLFEFLPGGQDEPLPDVPPALGERAYLATVQPTAVQTRITVAFPSSGTWTESYAERMVLREMLDLEMKSLRERLGATYGVQVELLLRHGPGLLRITANVDPRRAGESYQAMHEVLERIRSGAGTTAFVRARRRVLRTLLAEATDARSIADELESVAANRLAPDYFRQLRRDVAEMRLSSVTPLIAQDLGVERQVVSIVGSAESIAEAYRSANVTEYEIIRH